MSETVERAKAVCKRWVDEIWNNGDFSSVDEVVAKGNALVHRSTFGGTHKGEFLEVPATGKSIEEYAARHLFEPLGITSWFWKRTPVGPVDTLGGPDLAAEDLARVWQLFGQNGSWDGRQIVPEEWVAASTTPVVRRERRRGVAAPGHGRCRGDATVEKCATTAGPGRRFPGRSLCVKG